MGATAARLARRRERDRPQLQRPVLRAVLSFLLLCLVSQAHHYFHTQPIADLDQIDAARWPINPEETSQSHDPSPAALPFFRLSPGTSFSSFLFSSVEETM